MAKIKVLDIEISVVSTYNDVSDLINDFGYKPDTSLEIGIDRLVKWYKQFYGGENK